MTKKNVMTAYHEAAHAVAHIYYHIPFRKVSIIPHDNESAGRVETIYPKNFHPEYCNDKQTTRRIKNYAIIYFAGCCATKRLTGKNYQKSSSSDFKNAIDIVSYICGSNEQVEKLVNELFDESVKFVDNNKNWFAIERLSEQLLIDEELGYYKTQQIVKHAFEDYGHD